jgi:hypothetical protein
MNLSIIHDNICSLIRSAIQKVTKVILNTI